MLPHGFPDGVTKGLIEFPLNVFICNITVMAGKTIIFLKIVVHETFSSPCTVRPVTILTSIG
jgi:hypothetical protein